jgi:hypothetical protein
MSCTPNYFQEVTLFRLILEARINLNNANPPPQLSRLRNKIWSVFAASSEQREIHLANFNTEYPREQPDPPVILQVSREARLEGMKYYTPCRESKPVDGEEISACPLPTDSHAYRVARWKLARIAHRTVWINLELDCLLWTAHCPSRFDGGLAARVIKKAGSNLCLRDTFNFGEDVLSQIKNVTIKTPNQGFSWQFLFELRYLRDKSNIRWLIKVERWSDTNRYCPFKSYLRRSEIEDYMARSLSFWLTMHLWFSADYRLELSTVTRIGTSHVRD